MFQFHKVRLKEREIIAFYYNLVFQFHKVRLKEPPKSPSLAYLKFQFHKVRLKGWITGYKIKD